MTQPISATAWTPPPPTWPPANRVRIPLPALAPIPPAPTRRSKPRWPIYAAAALCLILAVVAADVAATAWRSSRSPGTVTKHFYAALSRGDAAQALAYADSGQTGDYLTNTVLAQQLKIAPLTDVAVTDTSTSGSQATVDVSYTLGFAGKKVPVTDSVTLNKHGSIWRLAHAGTSVTLAANGAGSDRITLVGQPLPTSAVTIFPGAVPVSTDTAAVAISGQPHAELSERSADVAVNVTLADSFKQQVTSGLEAALNKCLAASSTDPYCPLPSGDRPVPGSLHGTLTKPLSATDATIALSNEGKGQVDIAVSASVQATWKVWNFNNQAVSKSESSTIALTAHASVDAPQTIVWVQPNA